MKVILVQPVEHLGEIGDIVDVANGYGRNYLVPRGLAIAATAKNERQFEHQKRLQEHRAARARQHAEGLAEQLQAASCSFRRKVGEEGRLFGSVTAMDIADQLKEAGFEVERRRIQLDQPIKTLGEFTVPIRLRPEVTAEVKVSVEPEE